MALTPEKVQQMKVDELKVEMRKRGLKVSGSKSELLRRLREDDESAMKRTRITNNDGKYYSGRAESQCDAFLAAGEFRNVFVGLYTQGPRAGQKAVKKVFKTGCVYEDAFFQARYPNRNQSDGTNCSLQPGNVRKSWQKGILEPA